MPLRIFFAKAKIRSELHSISCHVHCREEQDKQLHLLRTPLPTLHFSIALLTTDKSPFPLVCSLRRVESAAPVSESPIRGRRAGAGVAEPRSRFRVSRKARDASQRRNVEASQRRKSAPKRIDNDRLVVDSYWQHLNTSTDTSKIPPASPLGALLHSLSLFPPLSSLLQDDRGEEAPRAGGTVTIV
jgi:hypothetical protein